MKYLKIYFTLIVGALFTLISCNDDEVLNLQTYPDNQPSISASGQEEGVELVLSATYNDEGKLEFSEELNQTFLIHFTPSPEDIVLSYEIISENIPSEMLKLSVTKDTILAGYSTTSVTVLLGDEFIKHAEANREEVIYEVGVKVYASGYKVPSNPIEFKTIINKEAYTSSYSVVGEEGSVTSFDRIYSQGKITNETPISYSFKVELDKPALKDTKFKFSTLGLDDKFLNTVTMSESEITIPAGSKLSEVITWSIKDDFLLETEEEVSFDLTIALESDDPSVIGHETQGNAVITVSKKLLNFSYVGAKLPTWTELAKNGWSVGQPASTSSGLHKLIDGSGGEYGSSIYTSSSQCYFTLDFGSEQTFSAIGLDYYRNSTASSPKKVRLSTSNDKENWIIEGLVDTPQSYNHYFLFFAPTTARYVKIELMEKYNSYLEPTEIYVYQ